MTIVGASGSGKSTLLNLLGALDRPTEGRVLLDGEDLSDLGDDARTLLRRDRIGFVFQFFNLLPTLTAIENVSLPANLAGSRGAKPRVEPRSCSHRSAFRGARHHRPDQIVGW